MPSILSWSYATLVVMIGWVFFRIENFSDAFYYVLRLFGAGPQGELHFVDYLDKEKAIVFALALLSCSTLFYKLKSKMNNLKSTAFVYAYTSSKNILLMAMFIYSLAIINAGSYNPFIYFRF